MSRSARTIARLLVAVGLCVLGSAVIAWALVGDLSTVPESALPDRLVTAPDLSAGTEAALLVVAAGALLGAFVLVPPEGGARRRLVVLVPALALGSYLGFFGRVVTAGVIGANIGGGILLLFVTPWLVPGLLYAIAAAVRARTRGVPPMR